MKTRFHLPLLITTVGVLSAGVPGRVLAMSASHDEIQFVYSSPATVGEAQGILQHLGLLKSGSYKRGTVDEATRDALLAFQRTHTLRPTGQVDGETFAELLQHRPGADSDGDGVPDARDKCPGTPQGAKVDARGCPMDADGDGVADGLDKCPNTPHGVKVNADGCAADSDGDGVADDKDRCPDTPHGRKVDARGCEEKPEPEPAPAPAPAPAIVPTRTPLVLEGVNFETNSSRLTSDSQPVLDKVAAYLKANPDVRVEISGHTDSTGPRAINDRLSKERAGAVRDYLTGKGVAASRLEAKGYGSSRPIADNGTSEGRARNRRVELKRID